MTIEQSGKQGFVSPGSDRPRVPPGAGPNRSAEPLFWMLTISILIAAAYAASAVQQSKYMAFVAAVMITGAIYLVAVTALLRRNLWRGKLIPILIVAALLRALAITPAPNLSSDVYRYVWDGRVQAAGFNPYLYVPADPRIAHLRDEAIYPNVNQKERAVSIYPPAAQLLFLAAHHIADGIEGMRAVMAALDLVTIGALLAMLSALHLPKERVLIYAWHPLPVWEFVCHAHIDAAATAAITLGVLAAVHARQTAAGAFFAFAAATKYFPLVLLPAIWRRWDWRLPAALVVTAAALYVPYLWPYGWNGGAAVLGHLPHHLDNEGYRAGWGFHPIWLLRDFSIADPPAALHIAVSLVVLTGLALWALLARQYDKLRLDALVWLGGAFVFLTSPHYPWYFAFLVALLVASLQPAVLAMTLLAPLLYLPQPPDGLSWTSLYLLVYWLPVLIAFNHALLTRRARGEPPSRPDSGPPRRGDLT